MTEIFLQEGEDVLLTVWAVPGASRSEIVGIHDGALRVRVAQPPSDGRANDAIGKLIASRVGGRVTMEEGSRSRRKRFRIHQAQVEAVREALLPGSGGEPR